MKRILRLGGLVVVATLIAVGQSWPEAKITVRVVDENASPMADAEVGITFDQPKHKPGAWGSSDVLTRNGKSNSEGLFSASERSGNYVNAGAKAPGYYSAHGKAIEFWNSEAGKWKPWNSTVEVILKKILNPIPMYARRIETEIPVVDAPIGLDLVASDWVPATGHGKTSDFIFKLTKRVESFHDFGAELLLSFPNPGDGIQGMPEDSWGGSELRSPHSGPEAGYSQSISLLQGNSKQSGEYGTKNNPRDYFFRTRTITDPKGQVVSALYGKIYGSIEYFPVSSKTAKLRFTYYLNPTPNDRNVEFDPKRNLFTNLKDDERVTAP